MPQREEAALAAVVQAPSHRSPTCCSGRRCCRRSRRRQRQLQSRCWRRKEARATCCVVDNPRRVACAPKCSRALVTATGLPGTTAPQARTRASPGREQCLISADDDRGDAVSADAPSGSPSRGGAPNDGAVGRRYTHVRHSLKCKFTAGGATGFCGRGDHPWGWRPRGAACKIDLQKRPFKRPRNTREQRPAAFYYVVAPAQHRRRARRRGKA